MGNRLDSDFLVGQHGGLLFSPRLLVHTRLSAAFGVGRATILPSVSRHLKTEQSHSQTSERVTTPPLPFASRELSSEVSRTFFVLVSQVDPPFRNSEYYLSILFLKSQLSDNEEGVFVFLTTSDLTFSTWATRPSYNLSSVFFTPPWEGN